MTRSASIVLIIFVSLFTLPLWLGIAGGLIGLTFGLIGALFGLVFGLFGAVIGCVAWIFKSVFHILFGWHGGIGFHPWFHFNGYLFLAVLIVVLLVVSKRKD